MHLLEEQKRRKVVEALSRALQLIDEDKLKLPLASDFSPTPDQRAFRNVAKGPPDGSPPGCLGNSKSCRTCREIQMKSHKEKRNCEVLNSNLDSLRSFCKCENPSSELRPKPPVFNMKQVATSCGRGEFRERRVLIAKGSAPNFSQI
jgi:hypothetical protein